MVKNLLANAGDAASIPGSGRSPGEGDGNPLQYSCLENPMDRGAWWATVPGIAKTWKDLTMHAHTLFNTLQSDLILVLLLEELSAHYFPEYSFFSPIFLESYVHSISVCVCVCVCVYVCFPIS